LRVDDTLSRLAGTPPYLILFVSGKCWMHCSHCWFHDVWKAEHHHGEPLTTAEIEKIARSMHRVSFLSLTGGEAFLRDDIVEVAGMFGRLTRLERYDIPTSGYEPDLVHGKVREMLRVNPGIPFRVGISLDGTREIHDSIRGVRGSFDRTLETIELLREVKRKCRNFDMGIITTVSKHNQEHVRSIGTLVEEIFPEGEWQVNFIRGDPRDPEAADISVENFELAHRMIADRIERGCFGGHDFGFLGPWLSAKNSLRRKVILEHVRKRRAGVRCAAGTLGGVVYLDGGTYPCELLQESMGNLRDYDCDLSRLWNSKRASEVRKMIRRNRCFCTQECFLTVSILSSPSKWPSLIRERFILRRARSSLK